jgi:transmembrane sensor
MKELFSKYLRDKLTPEELDQLFSQYNEEELDEVLKEMQALPALENSDEETDRQVVFNKILNRLEDKKRINWVRVAVAAMFIGLIATGGWYFFKKEPVAKEISFIQPGSNKALLVLAGGQQIILDNIRKGDVAQLGNVKVIMKADSSLLVYNITGNSRNDNGQNNAGNSNTANAVGYNTLFTPRGGQFQVQLPDGSHVWLNAASSLRYPAAFTGTKREVELKGEAYFEVAKDDRKPFEVSAKGQHIKVLGTAFNIMAYDDEKTVKTTLVQGAIKVNDQLLHPGEQISLNTITQPNMKEVLSWKEGKFWFDGADINTIMRQIARWYDVDVQYEGEIQPIEFTGIIARTEQVSQLLEALEQTGNVHFKISGKKILVTK